LNAVTAERETPSVRRPWYREPWPWFLMAGPALVVVAGLTTAYIAFHGADGLVADDYYKQGLGVNRDIARDQAARDMGIGGRMEVLPGRVRVTLHATTALPDRITLRFAHPSRASEDRVVHLARVADDAWEAPLAGALPATRWLVIVETERWRVSAQLDSRTAAAALSPGVR
jgi:hypothetical protein